MDRVNSIQIPDHGGTVALLADLHLRSYRCHGSNPLELHSLVDRMLQESIDALVVSRDLSDMNALQGSSSMVIRAGAIIRPLMNYRQSIGSAKPDPWRVRRFIETAHPLLKNLIGDNNSARTDAQGRSKMRVCPKAHDHDHEAGSR